MRICLCKYSTLAPGARACDDVKRDVKERYIERGERGKERDAVYYADATQILFGFCVRTLCHLNLCIA